MTGIDKKITNIDPSLETFLHFSLPTIDKTDAREDHELRLFTDMHRSLMVHLGSPIDKRRVYQRFTIFYSLKNKQQLQHNQP